MEGVSYQRIKNFFFLLFSKEGEGRHTPTKRKMRLITSKKENKGQRVGIVDKMTKRVQSKKLKQENWNENERRKEAELLFKGVTQTQENENENENQR